MGCDPGNEKAVRQILALKDRSVDAGLILIADSFERFEPWIQTVFRAQQDRALSTWPGPITWLFPKSEDVPDWLAGKHETIALRVTAHPVCRAICAQFNGAIVSTSANPTGSEPARTVEDVDQYFGPALCGTVDGELGVEQKTSQIRDLVSGRVLR